MNEAVLAGVQPKMELAWLSAYRGQYPFTFANGSTNSPVFLSTLICTKKPGRELTPALLNAIL